MIRSKDISATTKLEILHDHYKETFDLVRQREKTRDRGFIWIMVLFAFIALQVGYPAEFLGVVKSVSILGNEFSLEPLPLQTLLSISWIAALAVTLRYCQTAMAVDRSYPYVHYLEEQISPCLGGDKLYQREGAVYEADYPLLLNLAWYLYVFVFPLAISIVTVTLLYDLWMSSEQPVAYLWADTFLGIGVISCFFIMRVIPKTQQRLNNSGDIVMSNGSEENPSEEYFFENQSAETENLESLSMVAEEMRYRERIQDEQVQALATKAAFLFTASSAVFAAILAFLAQQREIHWSWTLLLLLSYLGCTACFIEGYRVRTFKRSPDAERLFDYLVIPAHEAMRKVTDGRRYAIQLNETPINTIAKWVNTAVALLILETVIVGMIMLFA